MLSDDGRFSSASYVLFDKMLNPTTGPRSFGFIYCVLSLGFLVLRIDDLGVLGLVVWL